MASSTRIYLVTEDAAAGKVQRLVRAANTAQAIRHVVEPRFIAEVATPEQCVELGGKGTKIEDASA